MIISELIGSLGRFQIWLCFLVFLSKFGVAFHQMAIIFLSPPVKYQCPVANETCCENPVYDTTIYTRTIVTEWNLICDKSWLKDFTQTMFQMGVLLGSLICGMASDRYGRRPTMIISVIIEVFAGLMSCFLPTYWSFTITRMVLGIAIGGVQVVGFIIVMEYVGTTVRNTVSALFHVPFTAGLTLLALFGYFIRDYVYFQLAISLSSIILLPYICLLPESPRWLLAVHRSDEAIQLLKRVAKINKLPTQDLGRKIAVYQMEHGSQRAQRAGVLDLFRTPNLRKNILVMSMLWFTCSYCFYGVYYYISHLTGDVYINVTALGIVCLGSCFFSIPLMQLTKRKTSVIGLNVTASFCVLIIALIPEGFGSTIFGCIAVVFNFTIFIVVYLYCSEMFPTVVRNVAIGISSMAARLGAMIAPFVATLRPQGQWCAPVAFGILPLVAAGLTFMLPETKNCELLMTLEEGEALGNPSNSNENAAEVT